MNTAQQNYYNEIYSLVQSKGGIVISDRYVNSYTHIMVQCAHGHQWNVTPSRLKIGRWCPTCAGNDPRESERTLTEIVERNGGRILGTYNGNNKPTQFQCNFGHIWTTQPAVIKNGSWCPACSNVDPNEAENLFNQIVISKGGRIHGKYINQKTKIQIECNIGHHWFTKPGNIRDGYWCPVCGRGTEKAEQELHQIVISKGGKVLDKYINSDIPLTIQCIYGHQWKARPYSIKAEHYCSICSGNHKETSFKKLQEMVQNKGGKIIGDYVNSKTVLEVECDKGHRWNPWPTHIVNNASWCPYCKQSRGETEVSNALNNLAIPFISQYRHPLIYNRKYDFYFAHNNKHYLLEFDGIQHFYDIPFYNRTTEEFYKQQNIDKLKTCVALKTGYNIIRIDYTQVDNVFNIIIKALISDINLYLSSSELYFWLTNSDIPKEIIMERCPMLL